MTNSRRFIAPPRPRSRIVANETGRLEVVKTALGNVRFGSKADIRVYPRDVRFTSKADIGAQPCDVCFVPKADIRPIRSEALFAYEPRSDLPRPSAQQPHLRRMTLHASQPTP